MVISKPSKKLQKKLGIETFGFMGKSLLICSLHIMLPFLQYLFALYRSSPCKSSHGKIVNGKSVFDKSELYNYYEQRTQQSCP
jgi:hypothetical protein